MDAEQLEKYSSAITLSDMEIFVFPELMYSLVLANIMSPNIWRWRQQDCFKKLEGKNSYKKLMRLRQFIMDEYEFNLDLQTWGLTSKEKELKRFEKLISPEAVAKSNALFGYQGDKYYFDVDIRRHFGLDSYDSDIIPYWKTETVEAMDAFVNKSGYTKKAGECVSLSALYAAAAFIVCGVPLEDMYMMLTPLHSQNFIDVQDGILTNNRRLVTKTMWFNGTEISNRAQRALRNENMTIVAHCSGYVHCIYEQATIDRCAYQQFIDKLKGFLSIELTMSVFASFLRYRSNYQKYFQACKDCHGQARFLKAEVLFSYEHDSNYRIASETHEKLIAEVAEEDFAPSALPDRIRCDKLEEFLHAKNIDVRKAADRELLKKYLESAVPDAQKFVDELADFVHLEPRLPVWGKEYIESLPIEIGVDQSREQIIEYLQSIRSENLTADLAFYAYRDMDSCSWAPFVTAALQRNPVSIEMVNDKDIEQVYHWLERINDISIYDGRRLAQPDEVANYNTGDGLEKAFLMANVIHSRNPQQDITITVENNDVVVKAGGEFRFISAKGLEKQISIP